MMLSTSGSMQREEERVGDRDGRKTVWGWRDTSLRSSSQHGCGKMSCGGEGRPELEKDAGDLHKPELPPQLCGASPHFLHAHARSRSGRTSARQPFRSPTGDVARECLSSSLRVSQDIALQLRQQRKHIGAFVRICADLAGTANFQISAMPRPELGSVVARWSSPTLSFPLSPGSCLPMAVARKC